jgi:hypothetical protein
MTMPHKQGRPVELLYPDLAWGRAKQRLALLLEDDEADRRRRGGRRHRPQRRRLTRTTGAQPRQASRAERRR